MPITDDARHPVGYWMASDGQWYAPELHPGYVPSDPSVSTEIAPADGTPYDDLLSFQFTGSATTPSTPDQEVTRDFKPHDKHNHLRAVAVGVAVVVLIAAGVLYVAKRPPKHTVTTSVTPVQPCQSMVHLVEHPSAVHPVTNLYAPATGAATARAAIEDVEAATAKGGLLAACPYVTSQFVWDTVRTADSIGQVLGGKKIPAKFIAARDKSILHGPGPGVALAAKPTIKVIDLRCTADRCTAKVQSTTKSSYVSASSTVFYAVRKYGGKWYVSAV